MVQKRKSGIKKQKVATVRSVLEGPSSVLPTAMPTQADTTLGYGCSKTVHILAFATGYIGDILRTALWLLKKPLGLVTFAILLLISLNFVIDRSRSVLAPLCSLSMLPFSAVCNHQDTVPLDVRGPKTVDFARLIELQDGFNGLMTINADSTDIGLKLKQSEMATRDLVTLVGVSDLESRDVLVSILLRFVEDARKAGDGLHRLSAKIDGAVDRITIVNDYALRTIQSASNREEDRAPHIALQSMYAPAHRTEDAVFGSFNDAMGVLARETQRTLLEASLNAANLERLQEHLTTIHEICSREGVTLSAAHAELLSELWSILGGNRQARRKNEMQFALLQAVDQYRKNAHMNVVLTRDALQMIAADVEELRERAATPELVGERVPPEVMIAFIGQGIERLKEGRRKGNERRQALMNTILGGGLGSSHALGIEPV